MTTAIVYWSKYFFFITNPYVSVIIIKSTHTAAIVIILLCKTGENKIISDVLGKPLCR